jgi:hypothetical protein
MGGECPVNFPLLALKRTGGVVFARGTEGSNPSLSSGESLANLTFGAASHRRRIPSMIVGVPTSGASFLTGDRGFESGSLQQRVRLSQEPIFVGQEPRLSARVCPAAFPVRSAESRRARQHRTNPQQYLCRAIFQYRISGDAVATSYRVKVARPVPKPGRASSRLRDAGGSCELGSGSSKAERGPLIVPA